MSTVLTIGKTISDIAYANAPIVPPTKTNIVAFSNFLLALLIICFLFERRPPKDGVFFCKKMLLFRKRKCIIAFASFYYGKRLLNL